MLHTTKICPSIQTDAYKTLPLRVDIGILNSESFELEFLLLWIVATVCDVPYIIITDRAEACKHSEKADASKISTASASHLQVIKKIATVLENTNVSMLLKFVLELSQFSNLLEQLKKYCS